METLSAWYSGMKETEKKDKREEEIMFEQLVEIITEYVEVDKKDISLESRFMEDLGFTSFDFMNMLGEIEDRFDVDIDQEEAADIRTVQEAVEYLESISE